MNNEAEPDLPLPFGISAANGEPLQPLTDSAIEKMLAGPGVRAGVEMRAKSSGLAVARLVDGSIKPNNLAQAGWGIIYGASAGDAIRGGLQPLIDHRRAEAKPFVIFEGETGVRPDDTARKWLKRRKIGMDIVDPRRGVPFYLLIVAPPREIPFEFQYELDLYWAVGRLWFDDPADFGRYADSVVRYETGASQSNRRAVLFAPKHDFDAATQLFVRQVADPLVDETPETPMWAHDGFGIEPLVGEAATKAALANVLRGDGSGAPALLVSGSHGMQFEADDARQPACQGAIVCQDWDGYGSITEAHWFAASNVPSDANLAGMIHFFFACHGGGCSEFDNYDRLGDEPRRLAPAAFFSRLPQGLLAHPNGGALAVFAHIERAWSYSFQDDRSASQLNGFRDVLRALMRGERIGQATDAFNFKWASLSTALADAHVNLMRGEDISLTALGNLWIARDDARNFMILGDPAVRLKLSQQQSIGAA